VNCSFAPGDARCLSAVLRYVRPPTPSFLARVVVTRMRVVWIDMILIHVVAVAQAINASAVVGAVPLERAVAAANAVRKAGSV